MCDVEMPQAFTKKIRRSRKEHKCCECKQVIKVGSEYEYCSGIWEGQPDSFKTCASCADVRDHYISEHKEPIGFGDLANNVSECFCTGYGPKEYAESAGFETDQIMVFFPDYYED